jgi:hypothetical protein
MNTKKSKQTSSTSSPETFETNLTPKKKMFISNNDLVVENEKSKNLFSHHMQKADTIGEGISRNKALAERINANDKWLTELTEKAAKNMPSNNSKIKLEEITSVKKEFTESVVSAAAAAAVGADNDLRIGNENSDDEDPTQPDYTLFTGAKNSPHLNDPKLALINPLWSGVAFYMDLHGHAAKRGCFIYGNSLENELYQVENVLFAKLIAISSQHFDFEGCNFSVKNMYMRDKREGLSKEGSGRVAMYKTLGLIHSYTLECCYASGRVMNTIVPAINSSVSRNSMVSPPLHSDIPPKFLPEHYMDVGKAVAIAALDIVEMNPNTRIPNTSFGSLEALRNWLKFYIRSRSDRGGTAVNNSNSNNNNSSSSNNNNNNNNNISSSINANNINNMIAMTVNSNAQSSSLKKTNQRFYFQQKLNKISSKSTTNASTSVSISGTISADGFKNQQESATVLNQQPINSGSKSSTNMTTSNKLNNVKTTKESSLKKDDSQQQQQQQQKSKNLSNSQGNNFTSDKTKMPDTNNGAPTSIKTSSIGLVDFSNNLFNNPAQVGNTQFRYCNFNLI